MSTPHSGPPDPPGEPPDNGEWRTQQGVKLGFVEVATNIMERLAEFYAPEYLLNDQRVTRSWIRGGVPGAPEVDIQDAATAPNWFVGEQYLATQGAPHRIVFARTGGIKVRLQAPMRAGFHETGYKQIYNAVWTLPVHVWAFDDDDLQDLVNMLIAAAYYDTLSSNQGPVATEFDVLPKTDGSRGVVAIVPLQVGLPMWLPPYKPVRPVGARLQGYQRKLS